MASTNKTTNYNLSQFIGSDKPAWLTDYNQDMNKIDTQMKSNADANTVTDGKADTNTSNIGTLANLNTQAKTDLVSSINEVYNTAGTANNTATQAATNANAAKTEADALSTYFSITDTGKITATVSGGTIGNINDLYYALNSEGTLGKIYGRLRIVSSSTGTITVTLAVPSLSVSSQFNIAGGCFYTSTYGGNWSEISAKDITVNTNRTITFTFTGQAVGATTTIWFPACIYFFTDFGDIVNPNE